MPTGAMQSKDWRLTSIGACLAAAVLLLVFPVPADAEKYPTMCGRFTQKLTWSFHR